AYYVLERHAEAVAQYRKALAIAQETGSEMDQASTHASLATGLIEVDSFDQALFHTQQALELARPYHDSAFNAYNYSNLAHIWEEKGDLKGAYQAFQRAAAAYEGSGGRHTHSLVEVYRNLSVISAKEARFEAARQEAKKAAALVEDYHNWRRRAEVYDVLASAYEGLGHYDSALLAYRQFVASQDSLAMEEQAKTASELEAKYQNEKNKAQLAEQALLLSRQRNRQLLLGGALVLLLLLGGGGYLVLRQRQRHREREAQLALDQQRLEAENLREMDALKSRFFANISHEFRTPLTLLLGPLRQMQAGKLQGPVQTYLEMMLRNGERLLLLINQLLDLSRLEAGRMSLQLSRGDIHAFLRTVAAQFDSWAESKHIRWHVHIPSRPLETAFDPDKLEKVLSNLLANAFKFTPEEGDVWLRVEQEDNTLDITVEDNGIGMSEEALEHVFDRFYRVDQDRYEGTGIGLALVRELVELAEGAVTVSSTPGHGSTFRVRLPLLRDQAAPLIERGLGVTGLVPAGSPSGELTDTVSRGQQPLLLVVEDHADLRRYLCDLLTPAYRVITAEHGRAGLEKAQSAMPDLILTDIMMPEMDGLAFTRAIREDLRTGHIPVIQLTAKAGRDSRLEGLATAADDYLTKPVDPEELHLRVRNRIEQQRKLREVLGKEIVHLRPDEIAVRSADQVFLEKAISVIETYMADEAFSIEDLAREMALSRSQLHRKLKALTDQSASVFLRTMRLKRARQLLEQGAGTAAEISYQVGFGSPAYFSKCFKDEFGITPTQVREA
ncbi:MAG: response regulator, partial [Bacteroidetes bacterium]